MRVKGGNLSTTFTYGHPFLQQESQLPGQPRLWNSLTRRASASYASARAVELRDSIRLQLQLALANRPVLHGAGPGQPGTAGAGSQEPAAAAVDRVPWTDHSRRRAAYPRPTAELLVRAAGLDGGRESQRQARWHLCHAEGRSLQRHRSGVLVSSAADITLNRPSSVSFRLRPVKGLWTTSAWGLFVQDDWRLNSKLVLNLGVRYDYFGRYKFEATDPENPAGIINLDGEPDPSFTFGPPRSPERDLRGRRVRELRSSCRLRLQSRRGRAHGGSGGWGMMFQPLDPQNFETSIGMIEGVPASRTSAPPRRRRSACGIRSTTRTCTSATRQSTRQGRCRPSAC